MDFIESWILGRTPGDFITPSLLARIAGETYRPLNRDIARENLLLFKRIMDRHHVEFHLFFGTLLGAVREQNFIEHDYDIDIMIMEDAWPRLAEVAPQLVEAGFEFARCKTRGQFVTFLRNGEFIDVYMARKSFRLPCRRCWEVDGVLLSPQLLTEFSTIPFLGESFGVPRRYEEILAEMYGADWRIPRKNYAAPIAFDIFHPYRSSVILARSYLSPKTIRWLKRLMRRA
jgi:lipopolysaccharide cholinephosphotransferase